MYGTCPQICKNTKGSYDCECASGYRKVGDGSMCEADGENNLLLSSGLDKNNRWTHYDNIDKADLIAC